MTLQRTQRQRGGDLGHFKNQSAVATKKEKMLPIRLLHPFDYKMYHSIRDKRTRKKFILESTNRVVSQRMSEFHIQNCCKNKYF